MAIGRSSPRYQGLALLYSHSDSIRRYLAEYFVVVVQLCHQFLAFSKKSLVGQFKSSLTDTSLQQSIDRLNEWAMNIKDEVDYLNSQTLVGGSREISRIRSLVDRGHQNREREKRIKRKLQWLDACTTYDHEGPWKQARKRGNATIFGGDDQYQKWKSGHQSSTLLILGKLGSGKTVLTANIVDDLNLSNETVCYFFCRHDILSSCQARTIIGSLCAQLLYRHINDTAIDTVLEDSVRTLSYDRVTDLLKSVLRLRGRIYFVLDGIDECDTNERREVLKSLSEVQKDSNLQLLVSLRSQADDTLTNHQGVKPDWVFKIPEDNPDIGRFIESELHYRVEAGELVLGDPNLVLEIREALCAGAHGM